MSPLVCDAIDLGIAAVMLAWPIGADYLLRRPWQSRERLPRTR
jgi:hypothetical protein